MPGLTQGERDAVFEVVIDLMKARLKKVESLNPKARHLASQEVGG